ncbi:hypothetical protein C5167_019621 [Papaver somniferum]|uniref:Plant heme peroxidase family profile domain-containing protein n=1 Tax=Papaver somniferum TaxID=3469 RepID=A0A4Y7IST6_PAPSO|nr:hypothetical protein C5167_019621 [Papaver somniferum]
MPFLMACRANSKGVPMPDSGLPLRLVCPGVAARDSVALSGRPFDPVPAGRRDSVISYPQIAIMELAQDDDLSVILLKFFSGNFNEQEAVSLWGKFT